MFDLKKIYSSIKSENPLAMFFTSDFNAYSQFWLPDGDTTDQGTDIDELFTKLWLSQVISEWSTEHDSLDSGTRASLDSYCHHQIIYCKVNLRIPPPLPIEKRFGITIGQTAINRCVANFPWWQHLNINTDPNWAS